MEEIINVDFDKLNKEPDKRIYDFLIHIIEKAGYHFNSIIEENDSDYTYIIQTEECAYCKEDFDKFVNAIESVTNLKFSKNDFGFFIIGSNYQLDIPCVSIFDKNDDENEEFWLYFIRNNISSDKVYKPYVSSIFKEEGSRFEIFDYIL